MKVRSFHGALPHKVLHKKVLLKEQPQKHISSHQSTKTCFLLRAANFSVLSWEEISKKCQRCKEEWGSQCNTFPGKVRHFPEMSVLKQVLGSWEVWNCLVILTSDPRTQSFVALASSKPSLSISSQAEGASLEGSPAMGPVSKECPLGQWLDIWQQFHHTDTLKHKNWCLDLRQEDRCMALKSEFRAGRCKVKWRNCGLWPICLGLSFSQKSGLHWGLKCF